MSQVHWQEHDEGRERRSRHVVDMVFRIRCRVLDVDHACALSRAVSEALPWLAHEPLAGVHQIHGAASGNGWQRPATGSVFNPSGRTRLTLRVPASRDREARELTGVRLCIGDHELLVGEARVKALTTTDTLYCRGVLAEQDDEARFLALVDEGLRALGISAPRLLPGMSQRLAFPDGERRTRSLLVAGLDPGESLGLQEQGLGDGRLFGCGLFVPYKKIG